MLAWLTSAELKTEPRSNVTSQTPDTPQQSTTIVFATTDSISHRWLAHLIHHQQQVGTELSLSLLDRLVPGRTILAEVSSIFASVDKLYIVERVEGKRFTPRNPLGGYSELLHAFFTKSPSSSGSRGKVELLLVNSTCAGWRSLLFSAGWGGADMTGPSPAEGLNAESSSTGPGCEDPESEEDAVGVRGGSRRRAAAFEAFVRHVVCSQAVFPAGTVVHDVPAAVAAELSLIALSQRNTSRTSC